MRISRSIKRLSAVGLATATLTSCSNTQMAATGLALAGTMAAYGAYGWISSSDAETAFDTSSSKVFEDVQNVIKRFRRRRCPESERREGPRRVLQECGSKTISRGVDRPGPPRDDVRR